MNLRARAARLAIQNVRSERDDARKGVPPARAAVNVTAAGFDVARTTLHPARRMLTTARTMLKAARRTLTMTRTLRDFARSMRTVARRLLFLTAKPMNQNQEDRTTMFATVAAYMDTNKTVWTPVVAIGVTVADVNAGIAIIAAKAGKQQAPTSGAGDEKTDVRGDYEDKILEVADQLAALASKTANTNLAAQVDLIRSGVGKLSAEDLESTGKRVSAAATANLAALAD